MEGKKYLTIIAASEEVVRPNTRTISRANARILRQSLSRFNIILLYSVNELQSDMRYYNPKTIRSMVPNENNLS